MSIEDLTAFFAKLESDQALQDQALALQGARGEERLAGLTSLAAEHGFTVGAADWEHEAAGPAVAALEDEKLRDVVGGGCGDAVGFSQAQGGSLGLGKRGQKQGRENGDDGNDHQQLNQREASLTASAPKVSGHNRAAS